MSVIHEVMDVKLFVPGLLGLGASMVCSVGKDSGVSVPQRPPPYVFAIAWPILYLLIGYSLKETSDKLTITLFGLQISLLTLWPIVFSPACLNNVRLALYILALIIGVTVGIMCLHDKKIGTVALIPLLSWSVIAYLLNWDLLSNTVSL